MQSILKGVFSWMVFVTDCDKTLVHYETNGKDTELLKLPASSGSGQVATVSRSTLKLLDDISEEGTTIICASGMRASTLMQREPFFPSIKYWACENGGRIFRRVDGVQELVELDEWRDHILSNREAVEALEGFSKELATEGWKVDTNGYATMFRVKGKDVDSILNRIPPVLEYTFNLGHLDIQLPGCGKLPAVQWLIKTVIADGKDKVATPEIKAPYLFMGDDDNDIPAADAAEVAYITMPCSAAMQEYINARLQKDSTPPPTSTTIESSSEEEATNTKHSAIETNPASKRSEIRVAPLTRHEGTEELLKAVLDRVRQSKGTDREL
jgi:hydroxymethylpyrimidine pyrophosphatase-like HAD family hydrolase